VSTNEPSASPPFPDGHFYSPIVNIEDVRNRRGQIWSAELSSAGIDYRPKAHLEFIQNDLTRHVTSYDYPQDGHDTDGFFEINPAFAGLDSRVLFTMLRKHRPHRMIEVGSGYSSLLTADVNVRFLRGQMHFTCVEPNPLGFLQCRPGITRLIPDIVQDVDVQIFRTLEENDIVFIDSSHVSKTGSDVNYMMFQVLPTLKKGVLIHFHDIFLPREYPMEWVLERRFSWNEQYLLRALLMHSNAFEVEFGCAYAVYAFPQALTTALGGALLGGGSFWIRKMRD